MTAPATVLDALDVHAMLRRACAEAGGQKAWAARHGVPYSYLNNVVNGYREPTDAMLAALGLRRVVKYAPLHTAKTADAARQDLGVSLGGGAG